MAISVLLADDHDVVRFGLRSILATAPDVRVVADVADGREAVEQATKLHPDVAVLDIGMPLMNGLDAAKAIRLRSPLTRIIFLSIHDDEEYVHQAMANGAFGYVLKDAPADDLVDAIRAATRGERHLSRPLTQRAFDAYIKKGPKTHQDPDGYLTLTKRERDIFLLVARGLTSRQIATRYRCSQRTVETHRSRIMAKMGFRSRDDLIRYAGERKFVP